MRSNAPRRPAVISFDFVRLKDVITVETIKTPLFSCACLCYNFEARKLIEGAMPGGIRALGAAMLSSILVVAADTSYAAVSEGVCTTVRAASKKQGTKWFGVDAKGNLTPLKALAKIARPAATKIIFLHLRDDGNLNRTIMAAKLIFETQGNYLDQNWVRVQNNYKRNAFSVKYADYNSAHDGTTPNFDLSANFHLTAGRGIPFSTFKEGPRRQMILPKQDTGLELTYRAYLLNFEVIAAQGSCVDFSPSFPSGTNVTTVEVIDLLPTDGEIYYRSSIKFRVSE
jgi:hypothetical protein